MDITDEVRFRTSPLLIQNAFINPESKFVDSPSKSSRDMLSKNKFDIQTGKNVSPRSKRSRPKPQAVINQQGLIELDVSNRHLTKVPQEIFNLTRLEVLMLRHNSLRIIPNTIAKLHQLKKVDASHNGLIRLPETFTNLKHLREADLSTNQLNSLPQNLAAFKDLKILKLGYNKFENLSSDISELAALRLLELQGNKLWYLPLSFQRLNSLQHLSLAENRFDQLPVAVCYLRGLVGLDLHGNDLSNLPPDFDQLSKMKELNLSNNNFHFVPLCITQLKYLHSLDISLNQLKGVPERTDRLSRLKMLNVQSNKISTFDLDLPNLEHLTLAKNVIKNFSVSKMKKLKYLDATWNILENLSLGVYNLSKLQVLKLAHNKISYLSQDVILLQDLRHLDLGYNNIKSLPQVINDLDRLETFNIKGNKVENRRAVESGFLSQGQRSRSKNRPGIHRRTRSDPRIAHSNAGYHSSFKSESNLLDLKPDLQLFYPQSQIPTNNYVTQPYLVPVINSVGFQNYYPVTQNNEQIPLEEFLETQKREIYKKPHKTDHSKKRKPFWSHKKKNPNTASATAPSRPEIYLTAAGPSKPYSASEIANPMANLQMPSHKHVNMEVKRPRNKLSEKAHSIHLPLDARDLRFARDSEKSIDSSDNGQKLLNPFDQSKWAEHHQSERRIFSGSVSSAAATVADSETIGDALSLGDDDYAFQPTSVSDKRLVGVVSEVESLLNWQLVEPINSEQQPTALFKRGMNQYGTVKTLQGILDHRSDTHPKHSSLNRSFFTDTSSDSMFTHGNGVVPNKNDIIFKKPFRYLRNDAEETKVDSFHVTSSGGLFRSSVDPKISLYFPVGAVIFPITVTMQVENVNNDGLQRAKLEDSHLSCIRAIGDIVHLKQSHDVEFVHQVTITIPAPSVERGKVNVMTYDGFTCAPCPASFRRHHGYITLTAWHLSGKVAVVSKSRNKLKVCRSLQRYLDNFHPKI